MPDTLPVQTATLALEDGTEMAGRGFGAPGVVRGEVVFNTAMTGYVEALTDPSYRGQILVLTYPLVGNYGVPAPRSPGTLDGPYESDRIQVQGLVVQTYVGDYSHHAAVRSLGAWLCEEGVPAVSGIDTRWLTRRLREHGTMGGVLGSGPGEAVDAVDMRDVIRLVAPPEVVTWPGGPLKVLLIDAGAKDNIVRSLLKRGATVVRAPWFADIQSLAEEADGVVIGNGPGDPRDAVGLVESTRVLLEHYPRPVFGICLGNQILTLAAGGETVKLPYGHRGLNHPVQDLLTRRLFITSQNHGYVVRQESLPEDWEPWFVNVNDGTNEGVRSRTRPFAGVQFHPEAHPGPRDTAFLFDDFMRLVGAMARRTS
ncbi:MAG: glutamine-hydrolyzing carbamoyl-phosphate synthase small subunit [Deltaproteobacteria bacterium]|nr:glutamine-hydrolyzing carbamoyl-phosphate synthase small subunit [Deltaproteobacteria bacterium]